MSYGLTKQQNPEIAALEAQWWKDWWAQDFSWEGLKSKSSFYEVWQFAEDDLIAEPGTSRLWTRWHCPYIFADGTASPKCSWDHAQWEALEQQWGELISLAGRDIWLDGVVWAGSFQSLIDLVPSGSRLSIDWMHISHLFVPKTFPTFSARHVWFKEGFSAFGESFDHVQFTGAIFASLASFPNARFEKEANFSGARFLGIADFTKAQFTSTEHAANFSGARFSDKAEFSEIRFAHEAILNGAKFAGRTNFYATSFEDRALFDDVECLENIHFYKAAFVRRLTINRSIFYRKFNMEGITDGDPIALSPQPVDLSATESDGKITGLSGELKPSVGPTTQSYHVLPKLIAEGAVFHYDANFSNRDIISPSSFENARFYHWARFHGSVLHPNVSLHNTRFDTALGYRPSKIVTPPEHLLRLRFASLPEERDFNAWKKTFLKARLETHKAEFTHNGFYDALEASYRTLKQTMEDRRDRIREGQFFMYELRARRKRHDVPLWETVASWLYWGASDYGNSIFRPLILMFVMFAGLALVYFGMAEKAFYTGALTFPLNPDASDRLTQAFSFSLNNTFSPFSALDASKVAAKDEWTSQLLLSNDAGFSLKIKALATMQSLLTLTLAFLAGLAGRRRFQIN